jgi:hypothetical protein
MFNLNKIVKIAGRILFLFLIINYFTVAKAQEIFVIGKLNSQLSELEHIVETIYAKTSIKKIKVNFTSYGDDVKLSRNSKWNSTLNSKLLALEAASKDRFNKNLFINDVITVAKDKDARASIYALDKCGILNPLRAKKIYTSFNTLIQDEPYIKDSHFILVVALDEPKTEIISIQYGMLDLNSAYNKSSSRKEDSLKIKFKCRNTTFGRLEIRIKDKNSENIVCEKILTDNEFITISQNVYLNPGVNLFEIIAFSKYSDIPILSRKVNITLDDDTKIKLKQNHFIKFEKPAAEGDNLNAWAHINYKNRPVWMCRFISTLEPAYLQLEIRRYKRIVSFTPFIETTDLLHDDSASVTLDLASICELVDPEKNIYCVMISLDDIKDYLFDGMYSDCQCGVVEYRGDYKFNYILNLRIKDDHLASLGLLSQKYFAEVRGVTCSDNIHKRLPINSCFD